MYLVPLRKDPWREDSRGPIIFKVQRSFLVSLSLFPFNLHSQGHPAYHESDPESSEMILFSIGLQCELWYLTGYSAALGLIPLREIFEILKFVDIGKGGEVRVDAPDLAYRHIYDVETLYHITK